MKIAVRLDDITPDMDWERFLSFKKLIDEYNIKPLIGIVPDSQDENLHKAKAAGDFWEYVKELQINGWSIALHGYQHIYTTKKGGLFPLNHFSEFAGLPYSKQKEMLTDAVKILNRQGIKTDLFMAPAHSYDKNTLKALKETGFHKITDGFGKKPYCWNDMTFYPISFMLRKSLKRKRGFTTMVVHTNNIDDSGMKYYRRIFEKYREDFISYDNYLLVKNVKRGFVGRVREYFLAVIKHNLVKLKG